MRRQGLKSPDVAVSVAQQPVAMPETLSEQEAAVWVDLASHATQAGTLTPGMVPAFVRLCKAVVRHARWDAQIARDGDTYLKVVVDGSGQEHTEVKAHPLIGKSQTLETAIRGWMKDFAINPFGKPIAQPKAAEDPFAAFDREQIG